MKPLPQSNATTRHFWAGCGEGRFEIQHCRTCGHRQFPPRFACVRCHGAELEWTKSSGRGAVYSYTVVHRAPLEVFKANVPYVLAVIELEEGVRAMMNVRDIDPSAVRIGLPVEIFFEPTYDGQPPLPQARPRSA